MTKKELKQLIDESVRSAVSKELADIKKLLIQLTTQSKIEPIKESSKQVVTKSYSEQMREMRAINQQTHKKKSKPIVAYTKDNILNEILNETEPLRENIPSYGNGIPMITEDVEYTEEVPTMNNRPYTTQNVTPTIAPIPQLANVAPEHMPPEATMQFANMNFGDTFEKLNAEADRIRKEGGGRLPI